MSDALNIRKLMEELTSGRMRVPNFQRGFVWDPERVAYLIASIYKGYPFGSILLWRTKQTLSYERDLGPFSLPVNDPTYPTDYILDGQQRITSIFGVFQTDIVLEDPPLWSKVFYDLGASENTQDTSFFALEDGEVDPDRHFPLGPIFDPVAYRRQTSKYQDERVIERLDNVQARFKEALIPVQTISTEDKTAVAIVFERVNQRGVELDTVQLLTAWTWSGDFDLHQKFEELAQELAPFGFRDVGKDKDLLLRCCSAVLTGDPSAEALVKLNGAVVRNKFDTITTGIKGAIDFLRKNLKIHTLDNLPYDNILVPLAVYFAGAPGKQVKVSGAHRKQMIAWFWRTCFGRRYNSQPIKNMREDVAQINNLKAGVKSRLADIPVVVSDKTFQGNNFRINSVLAKAFILMLAQMKPRSFVSGGYVDLGAALKEYNRNEFHHVYPRSYLRQSTLSAFDEGCLANICFITRADNNALGGLAPSLYKVKMSEDELAEILDSNCLPDVMFDDEYDAFVEARSAMLAVYAQKLVAS